MKKFYIEFLLNLTATIIVNNSVYSLVMIKVKRALQYQRKNMNPCVNFHYVYIFYCILDLLSIGLWLKLKVLYSFNCDVTIWKQIVFKKKKTCDNGADLKTAFRFKNPQNFILTP